MKRLFFALWPDEATRQQCRKIQRAVRGYGRPVSPNNLHLTLVFLGNVDQERLIAMTKAAADIDAQPITLVFDHLLYWKRPAVVCLGVESIAPTVSLLVSQLTQAAVRNEIPVDSRPYQPHVTLLRKANTLPAIQIEPLEWRADAFCLVESCSMPTGVEYRVIAHWACAGMPGPDSTTSAV
ncbi:MAG: RNA 2',3'-cyclic phosphodiesterase [Methylomonas sp.]|nr:RNA 2',3'-cyclic phosphodiesterase [Methylomonas sp.]